MSVKTEGRSLEDVITELMEKRKGGTFLDLGAGQNPREGFESVDVNIEADHQVDLFSYPWKFEDDSVDIIYSSHFVEHVPGWDAFWNEVGRVLKPGGFVLATTPYWTSVRAFQDPDHKQPISEQRYQYLSRKAREGMKVNHYGTKVDLEVLGFFYAFHENFDPHSSGKMMEAILFAKEHYLNVVQDISVVLRAVEDGAPDS